MRWPLAGVAIVLGAGIFAGRFIPIPLSFAILIPLLSLASLAAFAPGRTGRFALGAALFLGGWAHFQACTHPWSKTDLRRRPRPEEELVVLRGCLEDSPTVTTRRGPSGRTLIHARAVLRVLALESSPGAGFVPASGRVLVSAPFHPASEFRAGSHLDLAGLLQPPPGPRAPDLFDYAEHLRWQDIHFELRTSSPRDWQPTVGTTPPPWGRCDRFQQWARRVLAHGLAPSGEEIGLLWAMTLGWKPGLSDELEEAFARSGTRHVFAISGLHIALVAGIAEQVLGLIGVGRRAASPIVILVCWAYAAVTGFPASAARASVMVTCLAGGRLISRPSNAVNSLAAAASLLLVWDPRQLFQSGFQLSFSVVGTLALLAPPLRHRLVRWTDPDPLLPKSRVPRWRKALAQGWRHLATALSVSLCAWIGSIPLCAAHFHLITLAGLPANVLVVPLASAALAANLGSLALAPVSMIPVELLNHAAWLFMHLMVQISRQAAAIPGLSWNTATPPPSGTAAWYLALAALGLAAAEARRPRRGLALLLLLAATLAGHATAQSLARSSGLRLVILPLEGGHSVWVRPSRGHHALIDTGNAAAADAVVIPFLRAQGVNHLDLLALSHGDIRHTGGALAVADTLGISRLAESPVRFRSTAHRKTLADLAAHGHPPPSPPPAPWRPVHPEAGDAFPRADDGCLVLELNHPDARVLLMADLDRAGQELLLQRHRDLRTDVLVLAPPARQSPPIEALLIQLEPQLVVVADSAHPATARARGPFRSSLAGLPMPVLYTSETGSLDLQWGRRGLEIRDARGRRLDPLATRPAALPGQPDEP